MGHSDGGRGGGQALWAAGRFLPMPPRSAGHGRGTCLRYCCPRQPHCTSFEKHVLCRSLSDACSQE